MSALECGESTRLGIEGEMVERWREDTPAEECGGRTRPGMERETVVEEDVTVYSRTPLLLSWCGGGLARTWKKMWFGFLRGCFLVVKL